MPDGHADFNKSPGPNADPITSSSPVSNVARTNYHERSSGQNWERRLTVSASASASRGIKVPLCRVLGRLAPPSIPLMLRSLILPAVLLAGQAMALNFTFAYVPGFFVQDDPNADSSVIGPVSEM